MPFVLALLIVLYSTSYLLLKNKPQLLKYRKWIDIAATFAVISLLLVWSEVFDYTFLLILYFFISLGLIGYLIYKIKYIEQKKERAQETIKVLKDEESVLEEKIQEIKNEQQ